MPGIQENPRQWLEIQGNWLENRGNGLEILGNPEIQKMAWKSKKMVRKSGKIEIQVNGPEIWENARNPGK